jgi:GH15 family glucan-1,4-alpha-glucosidase
LWETAGGPRLFVASRVQAWYTLDRAARLARAANPLDLGATAWQQEARSILDWLESDGLAFDGGLRRDGAPMADDEADSALLRIAWRGPWPAEHPIVRTTVERVLERLGSGPLLYRYSERIDDGRAGPDSPDLLASLWAVRALAALHRWDDAHERMEAVLGHAGTFGLLSETADPVSGELLGNLPSTGVHLAVVDAAVALAAGPH